MNISLTISHGAVWSTWSWNIGRHVDDEAIENTDSDVLTGDAGLAPVHEQEPGTVQLGFRRP